MTILFNKFQSSQDFQVRVLLMNESMKTNLDFFFVPCFSNYWSDELLS